MEKKRGKVAIMFTDVIEYEQPASGAVLSSATLGVVKIN
jgi:hypothetical protein